MGAIVLNRNAMVADNEILEEVIPGDLQVPRRDLYVALTDMQPAAAVDDCIVGDNAVVDRPVVPSACRHVDARAAAALDVVVDDHVTAVMDADAA